MKSPIKIIPQWFEVEIDGKKAPKDFKDKLNNGVKNLQKRQFYLGWFAAIEWIQEIMPEQLAESGKARDILNDMRSKQEHYQLLVEQFGNHEQV